jgi:hypothetical protein
LFAAVAAQIEDGKLAEASIDLRCADKPQRIAGDRVGLTYATQRRSIS